jgi:hypothetical protein
MDDVAELRAAELTVLPALEGLGDGHESATELFLVRPSGLLTQETLDPLGRVCHTLLPNSVVNYDAREASWLVPLLPVAPSATLRCWLLIRLHPEGKLVAVKVIGRRCRGADRAHSPSR